MNLKPYTAAAIAFGLALACIAGAVQQYAAAQSPGAVVPLAIGGVPGSVVGLGLLAVVGAVAGLWLLPRSVAVPNDGCGVDPCQEWIGRLAEHYAKAGDKRGMELVTQLAVYIAGREQPVKGGKS